MIYASGLRQALCLPRFRLAGLSGKKLPELLGSSGPKIPLPSSPFLSSLGIGILSGILSVRNLVMPHR